MRCLTIACSLSLLAEKDGLIIKRLWCPRCWICCCTFINKMLLDITPLVASCSFVAEFCFMFPFQIPKMWKLGLSLYCAMPCIHGFLRLQPIEGSYLFCYLLVFRAIIHNKHLIIHLWNLWGSLCQASNMDGNGVDPTRYLRRASQYSSSKNYSKPGGNSTYSTVWSQTIQIEGKCIWESIIKLMLEWRPDAHTGKGQSWMNPSWLLLNTLSQIFLEAVRKLHQNHIAATRNAGVNSSAEAQTDKGPQRKLMHHYQR